MIKTHVIGIQQTAAQTAVPAPRAATARAATATRSGSKAALRRLMPALTALLPLTALAQLEEVIVTGEGIGSMRLDAGNQAGSRLGLSALDTPASVDMITRDEILTKGDHDVMAALTRSTGLSSSANPGNGDVSVSARGFNGSGSVMTTFDGTRLYITAGTVTFPADTWTLDRIEILRGAGSVLNGLGAIGATINYVPKAPRPGTRSFEGLLALGSFDKKRMAVGGGADLSDDWAYRVDGAHEQSNAQVKRTEKRRDVAAGSLLFHPTETFRMKFSVDYADIQEDSPYFGTPLMNGSASDALRKENFNFADGFLEYRDLWSRVHAEWKPAPGITLHSDTYLLQAKRQWQNLEVYSYNTSTRLIDRDGFSYYGIIHDQQQLGTRADVLVESSWGSLENKLTVGADINGIDLNYSNNWSQNLFYAGNSVPVTNWKPDTLANANIPTVLAFTTDTHQHSLFFDDALKLDSQWQILLGARHDRIAFTRHDLALGGNPASTFSTHYAEWSWRGGVVFQPLERMSLYAQYSRATDPITSPVTMSAGNKNFDPTRGKQIEFGLKHQLMAGKAEYTLAWFDITKTGLVTRRPGSPFSEQIGSQSSRGIEGTLRINPAKTVSMDFNATWVDAQFDEYFSGNASYAGNVPNSVPSVTANAWLNWTPRATWSFGAGWRYVAARFANDANTRELPAYTLLDARVAWNFTDRVQFNLRGRNLTNDTHYVLSEYDVNQWLFGEPRTVELSVKYSL